MDKIGIIVSMSASILLIALILAFFILQSKGQEFNYILEGSLKVVIDKHELILEEGDSLYFDSGQNHAMKALNGKPAKFLAIII